MKTKLKNKFMHIVFLVTFLGRLKAKTEFTDSTILLVVYNLRRNLFSLLSLKKLINSE